MDQITSFHSDSLSSSSYQQHPKKLIKSSKQSYNNSLHSIRTPLRKPITKHFIAPLPPTPLKIYKVASSEFKEAVRELTSSPEFHQPSARRLKDKAPPPLVLSTIPKPSLFSRSTPQPSPPSPPLLDDEEMMSPLSAYIMSPDFCNLLNENMETTWFTSTSRAMASDACGGSLMSPLGFCLSPTSLSWCSSVLLSPGNLSTINQSSVL